MLHAHTLLWNYFWVAPNLVVATLGMILLKRGRWREFPVFIVFALVSPLAELCSFAADVIPSVSPLTYWRVEWVNLLLNSFLKFIVIGEVFSKIFDRYPSVSRLGRMLVSGFGGGLVLVAAVVAAFASGDSPLRVIAWVHLLDQTVFMIETGLIVFLFLLAGYFRLSWERSAFGILLGLGISASVHLSTWAVITNASPSDRGRTLLAFVNMATYHVCVLIWCYYLLVARKTVTHSPEPLPEHSLDGWNRELERLLQR